MDDVFVYVVDMPAMIGEMVVPCCDGYTVYINGRLTHNDRIRAYRHALRHVEQNDWNELDVQMIETEAHKLDKEMT